MNDAQGRSIFGAIEQQVLRYEGEDWALEQSEMELK